MSDGFSSVFHLVGLYSNKLTSGHKANGHIDNFRVPQIPCALELCLERQKNPYMYIGKFYLFILIAKCACFARMLMK